MSEAPTIQALTVGQDACGNVQLSGSYNTITVFVVGGGLERPRDLARQTDGTRLGANPYRSLDAFDEISSDLFFGRETLTATLLERVEALARRDDAPRLLTILGPSGSGKSSIARAGLLPAFADSASRALRGAQVAILQPGTRPVEALANGLARALTRDPVPVAKTAEFEHEIRRRAAEGTSAGLSRILRARGGHTAPMVLVIDQFEEVYTLGGGQSGSIETARGERATFVYSLLAAAREPGLRVITVLTLRSDFYGAVSEHPELSAAISASHVLVPAMTAGELADAIRKPAQLRGLDLKPPVVERLVGQARDNPSALPLVQHALFRFWNTMLAGGGDARAEVAAYAILADLGGAMAATAREVMAALPGETERRLSWACFLRGIQLGEGVRDTRRRVPFTEILPPDTPPEALRAVLGPFVSQRLLSLGGETGQLGEAWFEITHEALIRNWGDLQTRLTTDRAAERFSRRAQDAAQLWTEGKGGLWQGIDLAQLQDHARRHDLSGTQARFLAASDAAARRRLWFLRTVSAVLFVAALLLAGLGSIILRNNRVLRETTRAAQLQQALAVAMLSAQATFGGDAMTGMLAALSVMPDPTKPNPRPASPEAKLSLLNALLNNHEIADLIGHSGRVWAAAFSEDGKRVVTASDEDESARVWTLDRANPTALVLDHGRVLNHTVRVTSASFSPDGTHVLTVTDDHSAWVWDISRAAPVAIVLSGHTDKVVSASFSADGKRVVTASMDGTARVWDVYEGIAWSIVLDGHEGPLRSASISPDSRFIITASDSGTARIWDLSSPIPVSYVIETHKEPVVSAVFSRSGDRILTAAGGTPRLWDWHSHMMSQAYLSAREPLELTGYAGRGPFSVTSASISEDGATVLATYDDGGASLWDLSSGAVADERPPETARKPTVLAVPFSYVVAAHLGRDGRAVVTLSVDGAARVWEAPWHDTPPPILLGGDMGMDFDVGAAAVSLSPDCRTVLTALSDGSTRVWDLSELTLSGDRGMAARLARISHGDRGMATRLASIIRSGDGPSSPQPTDEELVAVARQSLTRCLSLAGRHALGLEADWPPDIVGPRRRARGDTGPFGSPEARNDAFAVHAPPC